MQCVNYFLNWIVILKLSKVLIAVQDGKIYTFAFSQGKLMFVVQDYHQFASETIFRARIDKLNQSNNSAFVSYAGGQTGFINLESGTKVQNGSILPVQLVWHGDDQKQAKLRTNWQLVGKYLVYRGDKLNRVSAKISNVVRDKFQVLLEQYAGDWVARSSVTENTDFDCIASEMMQLYNQAQQIRTNSANNVIYDGIPNYLKLLRNLALDNDCEIICNCSQIHQDLIMYQDIWQLDILTFDPKLEVQELINIHEKLLSSLVVEASNGATLEINRVSGINIIDVNNRLQNIANNKLNFLILDDVYQQICLRNLQGIILIDLIKNMSPEQQEKVINYLKKLFKFDVSNTKVLGFSHSGLCELIRNKF